MRNPNPSNNLINYTGVPVFILDVSKVSSYDVTMVEAGPYVAGSTYHVNVTAKNLNGTAVAWDGTVNLESNGAVFGSSTHTFTNNAYWETTVVFPTIRPDNYVYANDTWFSLDVTGSLGPIPSTGIPEFGLLVIPVVGAAVMFAMFKRRRKPE